LEFEKILKPVVGEHLLTIKITTTMKKLILLCLSVLGTTSFAGAWMSYTPQSWDKGSGNTKIVTCHNTSSDPCMAANGDSPKEGQTVAIFGEHGIVGWGTIIKCLANPEPSKEGNPPTGQPTVLEVALNAE
jgi:hypothetical protein